MSDPTNHPASYKDPAGFVFWLDGKFYRHINSIYEPSYRQLIDSGLYTALVQQNRLIRHTELGENLSKKESFYKTLLPEQLSFVSYAYEWSFDMLKDAALLTLQVCREAIGYGMILKDATPSNIQFIHNHPLFVDTLSFQLYNPAQPWIAYRQFCEEFLAPLLIGHYTGTWVNNLLLAYPNGIPVEVAARLLPFKSKWNLLSSLHIHLQARVKAGDHAGKQTTNFSRQKLLNILDHLSKGIQSLQNRRDKTTWSDYYDNTIKSQEYLKEKKILFTRLLEQTTGQSALDLGANAGAFSRLLAEKGYEVVACDFDGAAVNQLYLQLKKEPQRILPLVIDISNPSPAIGWDNQEKTAFLQRKQYDLVVALALVHHLVIGKNVSLQQLADTLYPLCNKFLLIEWVEREDEKVKILLQRKELDYANYNKTAFERGFATRFELITSQALSDGLRILYLWRKK
ncbi:MAG: class I SAM-dependent methyltransferase [Williamsia sp.]|nr:class I SAM-dependent methyltransferase [Williamsia sp.]